MAHGRPENLHLQGPEPYLKNALPSCYASLCMPGISASLHRCIAGLLYRARLTVRLLSTLRAEAGFVFATLGQNPFCVRLLALSFMANKSMKKARKLRAFKAGQKGSAIQKIMQCKQGLIR